MLSESGEISNFCVPDITGMSLHVRDDKLCDKSTPSVCNDVWKENEKCVSGAEIKYYRSLTLDQCKNACKNTRMCKGVEFFTEKGIRTNRPSSNNNVFDPLEGWTEGDCYLKSSDKMVDCSKKKNNKSMLFY